ncbi:MAG: carboxypeptidase-like regulatory domain-containing protein [Candidatus Thiodiazotropha sp. (ex Monitilora ramsayi)]|nr:carboxypeptidase-like regulatory domain-containing protein [Candidatus Thiodiazotropha sp. (ex Monitilora ramsayi)]
MKKILPIILILLVTGCANVAISLGTIGVVTDHSGNAIQAKVEMTHKELTNKSKSTTTEADGKYTMSGLRTWTPIPFSAIRMWAIVKVTAPGYEPYEYEIEGLKSVPETVKLEKK